MDRAERRRRCKKFYNKRVKRSFEIGERTYKVCGPDVACHECKTYGDVDPEKRFGFRKASSWKDLKEHAKWIRLYKNTRCFYNRGLWSKCDKHLEVKRNRKEGKEIIQRDLLF